MVQRVLFVCLGNICRSPAAEGVFLKLIQSKGLEDKYFVDSAGTGGWHVGRQPDPRIVDASSRRGISLSSRARQIQLRDFYEFDWILTMDNDNLEIVNSMICKLDKPQKAIVRPVLSYARKYNLSEVPDPYYGSDSGFEYVLDILQDACQGLLEEIN